MQSTIGLFGWKFEELEVNLRIKEENVSGSKGVGRYTFDNYG